MLADFSLATSGTSRPLRYIGPLVLSQPGWGLKKQELKDDCLWLAEPDLPADYQCEAWACPCGLALAANLLQRASDDGPTPHKGRCRQLWEAARGNLSSSAYCRGMGTWLACRSTGWLAKPHIMRLWGHGPPSSPGSEGRSSSPGSARLQP